MPSAVILQALPLAAAIGAAFCHGERQTDAKWLTWATQLEKGVPRARKWAHRPRLQRSAIQAAAVFLAAETALGLLTARGLTTGALILAAAVLAAWTAAWAYQRARAHARVIGHVTLKDATWHAPAVVGQWWNHRRGYTIRLRDSAAAVFGVTPWQTKVAPDRSYASIVPPYTFAGHEHERLAIVSTVGTLLHREGLEADWSKLHGRKPRIVFTQSEPPPSILYWENIARKIDAAKYDQLVSGIGHYGKLITSSLEEDSPMLGIGAGTGGGKSNLAAFWLVQRLRKGDFGLLIDGKRFSHPWAFKEMDARYGLLPNVGYVREISEIHDALVWLGMLLAERNALAERYINAKGDLLGDVGRKLWVVLEELNLVTPMLKTYWQEIRQKGDPKESPALMALSSVSCAGRAVGIHLIFIGQRLDAEVLGSSGSKGGAVRGNVGVRAIIRYDEQSWALQAGKGCPMPPSPSVPGRIQLWVRGQVYETQVPLMDHKEAISELRELATGGIITPCPVGMPGRSQVSVPDRPAIDIPGQSPVVLRQTVIPPRPPGTATIREALDAGLFGRCDIEAARKRVQRARLEGADWDGTAKLYSLDDLRELVR